MNISKDVKKQTCTITMSIAEASALVFALDQYNKNPNSQSAVNFTTPMFKELISALGSDMYGFIDPIK